MKFLGLLIVGICISFYGFICTTKIISSQKQIEYIIEFINYCKECISYSSLPVKGIISNASEKKKFNFLFSKIEDSTLNDYFENICKNNDDLLISNEDKVTLYDFLTGLGKSDTKSQIDYCDMYINIFENLLNNNAQKCKSKIKLYPTFGVLGGLMVVVLFI